MNSYDADVIVIGSGFGGAVTALRLAQAGHRVLVLEKGRRLSDDDLLAARSSLRSYLWQPQVGLRGFFWQRILRHVAVIGASAVGGGSVVWAGVLLTPPPEFYRAPALTRLGHDWEGELAPHLETAAHMLGRVDSPHHGPMDDHLQATAAAMGREHTFGPVPLAIHFGRPGVTEPDPFFGGDGPERTGCRLCGECLLGCPYGAKNQLTRNYLYLAERCGAQILPEREVETITPSPGGGYVVATRHPWRSDLDGESFSAPRVVVAAGVLGTLELLLRNRDEHRTLPQLSQQLGHEVRTNSEALTAIMQPAGQDLSVGPTISSDFHPDDDTHTTINRYMGGSHMRLQLGPLVDDERPARRGARTIGAILRRPWQQLRLMTGRGFLRRLTVLTTMQHAESRIGVQLRRSRLRPWRTALNTVAPDGVRPPSYLAVANEVTRRYAEQSGGRPLNLLGESVGGLSVTAHVLGGAVMGRDASEGVVDVDHETFGHPGLYVMDASVIPANLGVNPSLTITAFAERFAARFPAPLPDAGPAEPVERPLPAAVSLLGLKRAWSELDPVRPDDLPGADLEASFLTPLRRVAPAGLGLIGLPRWFGKRFAVTDGSVSGVNLLRTPDGLRETMPMQVAVRPSLIDGAPTTVVAYAPGTRRPWPWVRDEMRSLPDGRVVGMTVVDLPVLRRLGGTPFLLTPRPDPQD